MNYNAYDTNIIVTGHSKIPRGIAGSDVYSLIGLSLVIDKRTHIILEADCNLIMELPRNYVRNLLVGRLITNIDEIEELFKEKYHGSARKSLIVATKVCFDRYQKALENIS